MDVLRANDVNAVGNQEADASGRGATVRAAAAPRRALLDKDDPRRMDLTEEERDWALDIKETVEASSELDNLTDFKYAQLALMDKGNIEKAVERAHKLQLFREEYGVMDTQVDARRHVRKEIELMPRMFMCYIFEAGNYVMLANWSGFNAECLVDHENMVTHMVANYYILTCYCPDLEAIRQGLVALMECEGSDQQPVRSVHMQLYRKFWSELAAVYPMRFKKLKHFHTGVFINLLYSMIKRFLTPEIRKVIEVGCEFDGRLDQVYLTPTVEEANARLLQQIDEALGKRYENERTFTLERPAPAAVAAVAEES